jgi:hypothetical protein
MLKVHDTEITVYQKPDPNSEQIVTLAAGDIVKYSPGFISGGIKRQGRLWLKVGLQDGRRGYIQDGAGIENIGNGTRVCPQCWHLNSTEALICAECGCNLNPALFRLFGSMKIPIVCTSCCCSSNLEANNITETYSAATATMFGNTGSTLVNTLTFTTYVCSDCRRIQEALTKHDERNMHNMKVALSCVISLVLLAVLALLALLAMIQGQNFPVFILPVSLALIIGICLFMRLRKGKMASDKAIKDHIPVIKTIGHTYQPFVLERPDKLESGWILKIYSMEYARLFELVNKDNPFVVRQR